MWLIRLADRGKGPPGPLGGDAKGNALKIPERERRGARRHPDSNSMHPTPSSERRGLIMEQVPEKNLKTPPESDPRKVNRNVPAGSETSLVPEDFDVIRPKDG